MTLAIDTDRDVQRRLQLMIAARTPEERLAMAADTFATAVRLLSASLPRETIEDSTERRVTVLQRLYGPDLDSEFTCAAVRAIRAGAISK